MTKIARPLPQAVLTSGEDSRVFGRDSPKTNGKKKDGWAVKQL